MKHPAPEFSRPLQVDRIPKLGCYEKIFAEAQECAALAQRLDVPALYSLSASLKAQPWRSGGVKITGELQADIEQTSVISLQNFRSQLSHGFVRYFLPPHTRMEETEDDADVIELGHIDMGEIVTETLALELDPYPRLPGEVFTVSPSPDDDATPVSITPFAELKKLK